jgi:transcriptional regulator
MYIPPAFAEFDLTKLHAFIEQHSFGAVISQHDDLPFATHLPFLLERNTGSQGTLVGHMARANPHWQQLDEKMALSIFTGPHSYISPTWYAAEHLVPTWNYTAVHVYGRVQLIQDQDGLLPIVRATVETYERNMPQPWSLSAVDTFTERLLAQIVGFRIEIDKIEGKWKLNQNHPAERRLKVIAALQERNTENASAVADLMRKTLQ